jgi:hypothetical protein
MPHSRYQTAARDRSAHQLIQELLSQPFERHRATWECFVKDVIRLPLCYVDNVHQVIAGGRWKAKFDPIAFIRKTAQTAALTSFGLAEQKRDRTKTYVGRAIDPEQKRPRTLEESLQFTPPMRRPEVYAGNIADLRLPRFMETNEAGSDWRGIHDAVVDHFTEEYGQKDFCEPRRQRDIAPDVVEPLNSELVDELESGLIAWDDPILDPKVGWERVADKADLDKGERMVLKCKLAGESRDSVMARQRSPEKRQYVQAAWRRFDRKWPRIVEAIKRSPSEPPVTPPPTALPSGPLSAPEALRRLKERRQAENNKHRLEPDSLPSLPRYTDYAH